MTLAAIAAVVLAVTVASAAGNHAVGGDRYEGNTSQNQATVVVVSADGHWITAFLTAIAYDHLCTKRGGPPYQISSNRRVKIGPGGSFAFATRSTTAGPGSLAMRVSGVFAAAIVRGTIAATGSHARCPPPKQHANPYEATFTARGTPAVAP